MSKKAANWRGIFNSRNTMIGVIEEADGGWRVVIGGGAVSGTFTSRAAAEDFARRFIERSSSKEQRRR